MADHHEEARNASRPQSRPTRVDVALAERLARIYRLALDGDGTQAARALVKERLLEALGLGLVEASAPTPALRVSQPPPTKAQPPSQIESKVAAPSVQHLAIRLRQLVEADAPWQHLRPAALALFKARADAPTAAKLVELAFLHGTVAEVKEWLSVFQRATPGFYRHLHAAIRAHMVVRLWKEGEDEQLPALLLGESEAAWLQPIECLYVWHNLQQGNDPAPQLIYFSRHAEALLEAAETLGSYVGWTPAALRLAVGRAAVAVGQDEQARDILAGIDANAPERDEALTMLLEASAPSGASQTRRNHYAELLMAQAATPGRLALLKKFLDDTRGLGGFRDRNRPALNQILKDPLQWIPEDPRAWAVLSDLLIANRDLEALLPNLWCLFRDRATKFGNPVADAALWQGPMQLPTDAPARDQYWRGVAALHHYVNCGVEAEASLWEARTLIANARRSWAQPLPLSWRELHLAASAWVAKNHYLLETDRQSMLRQLRVAGDFETLATSDLDDYIKHSDQPPADVLRELQDCPVAKRSPALAARLVLKRAGRTHLVSADLDRLWHLANDQQASDLAWRVATVVHARQSLAPAVRHAWEISGEKRGKYPIQTLSQRAAQACSDGFSPLAMRLCQACLRAGAVLPELLAMLDPGASSVKISAAPADSEAARIEQALQSLAWLPRAKRQYRYSSAAALGSVNLPAFMHVLPANPWSLLVEALCERLGINAWGWRLSKLGEQITDLVPRIAARQDLRHQGGKIAKWLGQLSPEQRAGWQEFALLARQMPDQEAVLAMAAFVCRLATALMPHHYQALISLQAMRAPVVLIWDLEQWILGERYSELRKGLGLQSQVLVPNALQRLASIHAAKVALG